MSHLSMPPKTVAFVGAVCLTTGWLLASLLTPPVANLQALPERRTARPATADEQPQSGFSEHLQWRLQQAPQPPTTRRNPFVFSSPARSLASITPEPAAGDAPATDSATDTTVSAPIFALSGIGIAQTPTGEVRTAVITDGAKVHLVKVGDSLDGYRIVEVTVDSVTLTDASGAQTVIRLHN